MHDTARTLYPAATVRGDDISVFVALELSRSTWLVAVNAPQIDKISKYRVEAGDGAALLSLLSRLRAEAERRSGRSVKTISIQEAGLDGFWVHRLLQANGVESHVVDAASIAVNRRRRRVKTDRRRDAVAHLDGASDLGTNRERHRGHEADEADVEPGTEEIRDRAFASLQRSSAAFRERQRRRRLLSLT